MKPSKDPYGLRAARDLRAARKAISDGYWLLFLELQKIPRHYSRQRVSFKEMIEIGEKVAYVTRELAHRAHALDQAALAIQHSVHENPPAARDPQTTPSPGGNPEEPAAGEGSPPDGGGSPTPGGATDSSEG